MARKKIYAPETEPEPETVTISTADSAYISTVPPMPPKGPLGDLTPDVVEWFRLYNPAEFEARYIRPGHPKGPRIPIR